MRTNAKVTRRERAVSATANILSTTDLKGRITYVNRDFIEISGYEEDELTGSPHKIIRHPDMPSAVFKQFWANLESQKSWMGIVKNRCKNGDYYWIDAFASPIVDGSNTIEYQSVRRRARPDYVQRAEKLYKSIKNDKPSHALVSRFNTRQKLVLAVILPFIPFFVAAIAEVVSAWLMLAMMVAITVSILGVIRLYSPIQQAINGAHQIIDDPVARYVYTGATNDGGSLLLAMKKLESENAALIGRVHDTANVLSVSAANLNQSVEQTTAGSQAQVKQADNLASTIKQLSVTVTQVAGSTANSAVTTNQSFQSANEGLLNMSDNVATARKLHTQLDKVESSIQALQQRSAGIETILDVISNIAEQTNLLALNAAIEAARAGELGRGFAVVADEVRALATRSKQQTEQIRRDIDCLHKEVKHAVEAVLHGESLAEQCLSYSERTERRFAEILKAFGHISASSDEIAEVTQEQSSAAESMQHDVEMFYQSAQHNMIAAKQSNQVALQTSEVSYRLQALTLQFWQLRQTRH